MEKPIHNSLNELFDKANLSNDERDVYLSIRKHCEYWLLRSKTYYSQPFNSNIPNFIQRLARVLIRFFSENVSGKKFLMIKEMFPKNSPVHRVFKTGTGGVRATQNSSKIENTYFELEIMSFFLDNGFNIKLASSNIVNRKIPEFTAINKNYKVNIEAKQLNIDKILDNIFGDCFTKENHNKQSADLLDKGYLKIKERIKANYTSAISKYDHIDDDELYLIFISLNYKLDYMGKYCTQYLSNLPNEWTDKRYNQLLGVVIIELENTIYIKNTHAEQEHLKRLNEIGISEYHTYIP